MADLFFTSSIGINDTNGFELETIEEQLEVAIYETLDEMGIDYKVNAHSITDASKAIKLERPDQDSLGGFRKGDPGTSAKGAVDAYPRSGSQRWKALLGVASRGSEGATYEVVAMITGVQGIWKRLSELKDGGWIEVIGQEEVSTGSDADKYRITERGRRFIEIKEGRQAIGDI